MAVPALAARVVEVIADLGPSVASRYRYGSGCIVRGGTVLTAAHAVAGAVSVTVRDPDRREYAATVDPRFVGHADGPGPDLALLQIADPVFVGDLPPIGLAAVDRDSPAGEAVERCHAVGYPWFAETPSPTAMRDTVDAVGVVPVLAKLKTGLLSVQVTVTPRELPPEQTALGASEWSGMSGAPVFAGGRLLAVVTEHAPREGPSAITAVPLTALQADPAHKQWGPGVADPGAWWSRLGVDGIGGLRRLPPLPPPRQPPAYRWTLREFGRTLHQRMPQLLGRERELREIAAFATGSEGYRRLEGGAFTGKTALLYEAAMVGLPDEVDVVSYFMSRRASDASSGRFLAAVVPQLAYLCDLDAPDANVDQYRALWQQAADRAAQGGRHLLLVVDGLDEDLHPPGSASVASLLPALVGDHAHVLVSSRPHPDLPDDIPDGHPLSVTPVQLDPFKGAQELADLAKKEIYNLTHGDDIDLAVGVLGLLTAAAGPLSVKDLVVLRSDRQGAPAAADARRQVRRLVEERAARSLEQIGPAGKKRYEFAHASLLEYAQTVPDLCEPEFRQRIYCWASRWRNAGWPVPADGEEGTPQYLLDTYPATLAKDPQRLAELAGDVGWVEAAIASAGVDVVLANLRRAAAANLASATVAAVLAAVTDQAYDLRPPQPLDQPGYILRQLWMQAAELAEEDLAEDIRSRLQSRPGPGLMPLWTTRRASRALSGELGRHNGAVLAVAVLPDGRVVTCGGDQRVLLWDPAAPGTAPAELGRHERNVFAMAVLADGRVVTGGDDARVLVWDPATPDAVPAELGRTDSVVDSVAVLADGRVITAEWHGRAKIWDPAAPSAPAELGRSPRYSHMRAVAVIADGQVATGGGDDGRVLVWDPARPKAPRAVLGRHNKAVRAVALLPDGRVVTGGDDRWVKVWDPAAPGAARARLGRHDSEVNAMAVLADGRVVTGMDDRRVLVWDPAAHNAPPTELGRPNGAVLAMAVLADGRVVTGMDDRRVLVWDPAAPGAAPAELGRRHNGEVLAVAVLADGRVVTRGKDGWVLVWDPAAPGALPAVLGLHDGWGWAMAVLADGRVVTGGSRRVLVWDPAAPRAASAELSSHDSDVTAVAVLADGRVVTGGNEGRVLVWDLAAPNAPPAELGRHYRRVWAVAVLPDERVVTSGNDGRVLVWDPAGPSTRAIQLSCSLTALGTPPPGPPPSTLVIAHRGGGLSQWAVMG